MSADVVAEVLRRVLVPGVTGGELSIAKPFGPSAARAAAEVLGGLEPTTEQVQLERDLGAPTMALADDVVLRRIRRLAGADMATVVPRLDGAVVMLGALTHDLVAAFHPDLRGPFRRDAPLRLLEATARGMAEVSSPRTLRAALVRHAWLGELPRFSLTRTVVQWWVGDASFVGRSPPRRLLAWPDLRRVRSERRSVDLLALPELLVERDDAASLTEAHARALSAFFVASPLTDVALAGRLAPPFSLTDSARSLLAHPTGARLCRRAIALGEEGGKFAREVLAQVAPAVAADLA